MPSQLLPPSPNWYCSRAGDTSQDGIFAYATKNTVFLLNVNTNPPSAEGCLQGHSERVTGISFSQTADQTRQCATSSDDSTVKIWDVKTKAVIKEHKVHQYKVTTLHWSPLLKDLIVSGDEKGALVCWNLASNDSKLFIPESNHIFSLACSPHIEAHVAVGYKNALVLLIDINNKGSILQRLRGHEDEIQSICWASSCVEIACAHKPSHPDDEESSGRENIEDNSQKEDEYILLSGSKDRTIRVWGTASGKSLQTLRLPAKGFQRSRERGEDRGSRVWVAHWWIPNEKASFISSSHSGDMVRWDLSARKPKSEYLGSNEGGGINLHMRVVFNISQGPTPDTIITTSMDRKIICWNSSTLQTEWCLSTLGGFVYCVSASPLDPSRLALGVGDNMIRLWNTASHGQDCDVITLWQGIKAKVMAVCWHPTRENCLAYGTDEGRVGIYSSITQSNKPPLLSSTFHKKTVYALSWGPPCPAKSDNDGGLLHLYTCGGEGAILQHDPSNLQADAVNVNKIIRDTNKIEHMLPQRTEVSWCQDGRAVAMGNEDGSIDIFAAPNLLLLCTIHVHHKLINCLRWYPLFGFSADQSQTGNESGSQSDLRTGNDGVEGNQSEQQKCWLASGSSDPHVHVYDLSNVLGTKVPVQLDTPITSSMCCLSGHTLRVTALSWSPHGDSHLVSASYDGTAQVWDVSKGEPLYNYRGHLGRIFTCLWSALDEDVIYTGSEDFTVRRWKLSDCKNKQPPKKKKEALGKNTRFQSGDAKSKKGKKHKQKKTPPSKSKETTTNKDATANAIESKMVSSAKSSDQSEGLTLNSHTTDMVVDQSQVVSQVQQPVVCEENDRKKEVVQVVNQIGEAESSYLEEAAEETKKPSYQEIRKDRGKKKRQRSLFPLSCALDNRTRAHRQEDCVQLAAAKYGGDIDAGGCADGDGKETTHLGFFSDRKAIYDVLKEEGKNHGESGQYEQKCTLGLWKGNIMVELEEAKQNGNLTDMMVAMASIGGPDVWLEICEAYAQQLEKCEDKREDFIKAANYYVACHQVHKAIQVLMNNRHHREAAAIALARLPDKDPLLVELYTSWANQLEKEGSFEQAAKCFLKIDQPSDAIRLLCKKGDPSSLRAGLEVAILAQQESMATRLMARYVNECMLAFDWSQVQQVTCNHDLLRAGQLLLRIHETLTASWLPDNILFVAWHEEPLWSPWQLVVNDAEKQVLDSFSCWTTQVVNDIPLLESAVTTWAHDHHVDFSNKDFITRLYTWIEKTKPQGVGQSMATKQLLIYLSNEVILGQLSLYMKDIYQAGLHWLQAVVTCHNIGEYEIARGILTFILPKGKASIEELRCKILDQASENGTEIVKKTHGILSCLEAYYALSVLYYLWWNFGPGNPVMSNKPSANISKEDDANTISRNTAFKADNLTSSHEDVEEDIKKPSASNKSMSVNSANDTGLPRTNQQLKPTLCPNGNNSVTLLAKLEYLSKVLLSDSHATYFQLKHKLGAIKQAVARLVARHKEDEHVQSSHTIPSANVESRGVEAAAKDTTNNEGAKTSDSIAEDAHHEEQSASGFSGTDLSSGDKKDSATLSSAASEDTPMTEGDLSLLELTATLNATLKDIDQIPDEIKDHPFPELVSSALTLTFFTKQAAKVCHGDLCVQLLDLCRKTAAWGQQFSFSEEDKCRFSKYLLD